MKNLILVSLIGALAFITACGTSSENVYDAKPVVSESDLTLAIEVDTIDISIPAFSGSGFFRVQNDSIYFFDLIFLTVSICDAEGNFVRRVLGGGDGPEEIENFTYHSFLPDGGSIFLGSGYNLEVFDRNWKRSRKTYFMDFETKKGTYRGSDVDSKGQYGYNYSDHDVIFNNTLIVKGAEEAYIPVVINARSNPAYDPYKHPVSYYSKSKTIASLDLSLGKVTDVFGQRPAVYLDSKYIPIYDFNVFNLRGDDLLVVSKPDSLIRVFSTDTRELKYSFGVAGTGMNDDYIRSESFQNLRENWVNAHDNTGYYYGVFSDQDYVFRSYTTGDGLSGGMQIYQKDILKGDFKVHRRFNVLGKINDSYYADGLLDEDNEELRIFKFNIKNR